MEKKISLIILLLFSWSSYILAQSIITGQVTDEESGEALIGASIIVKGTIIGITTDLDGRYTIEVPKENKALLISYTGYAAQEILIDNQSEINIKLVQGVAMDEIVVVGYGTQKKSNVTGAISSVKEEDLEDMQITRLEQALQGRTSGIRITQDSGQPGSGSTVRIRGTSSFRGSNPLYVVDGMVIGGGIDYLNPSDIESIEVLKDAASAAIYGARAANGVIIVTTKSGKAGKMRINYSNYFGVQNPWKKLSLLDASEYALVRNEMAAAADKPLPFPNPEQYGEGTDWQDAIFNLDAPMSSNELSLSGGTDKMTYYSSVGIFKQEGIITQGKSKFSRLSTRLNVKSQVNEVLSFGANIAYTHIEANNVGTNSEFGSPLARALNLDPTTPVYETDEEKLGQAPYTVNGELRPNLVKDENGVFAVSPNVTSEITNPVAAAQVNNNDLWSDKLVPTVYGEVEIIKGLKIRSSFGGDLAFWGNNGFTPSYYLNATNVTDTNSVFVAVNRGFTWLWDNTISYEFKVKEDHSFSTLFGHSAQETNGRFIGGSKRDLPSQDASEATLNSARKETSEQVYGSKWEKYAIESYFGRLNYNYKEKYLLTAIMRMDASSKFGSNYRWGYFPSVSAGWNISDEDFWPTELGINYLKLRGGWGQNGNDAAGNLEFVSTISANNSYSLGSGETLVNGSAPTQISNPDLRWERVIQTNFGLDMRFLRHFSLTFDYFIKTTSDALVTPPLPSYVGNSASTANVGNLTNKGFDIELGYSDELFRDFTIAINGNASYNKNTITLIGNESGFLPGARWGTQSIEVTRNTEGLPIGYLFGYKTDGIFQNQAEVNAHIGTDGALLQPDAQPGDIKFVDFNQDGEFTEDDRTMIGDPTPTWTYGFTLDVAYKGIDLVIFGLGVAGNDIFNASRRYDLPTSNFPATVLGRWTGEGSTNSYPRLTDDDQNINFARSSDFYLEDGAFFRIKSVQLGYTFPGKLSSKARISRARIYTSITNLFTFTNYSGFDPEIGGGVDRGIYPQSRIYTVGMNITFE